jgi:D-glycero-D-manno-heptose 1,7-bisphosphate phosphatase
MPRVETAFLDRDGVVNSSPPDGDYIRTWEQFRFLPRAIDALRLLTAAGVRVIVATNQRGVARGLMSEDELLGIHARMLEALEREGAGIDAIYYCPHEKGECSCRKPDVGLFLRARKDFPEIDFAKSAMVGDSLSDMEAGQRLGCRNILVPNPHREIDETVREAAARGLRIHEVAGSLFDAVSRLILDDAQER